MPVGVEIETGVTKYEYGGTSKVICFSEERLYINFSINFIFIKEVNGVKIHHNSFNQINYGHYEL